MMLHTRIIPRLSFTVRPIPGIPGAPLQPIPVAVPEDAGGVVHAWAVCYAHLLALHALYARLGVRRPLARLHDLTVAILPHLNHLGTVTASRAAIAEAHAAVDTLDDDMDILGHAHEAGWWVVALQASLALGVWHEMAPDAGKEEAQFVSQVALGLRRILASVFEARVVDAIQTAAHGDGAGDLLAQVAARAADLGVPLDTVPRLEAGA